MIITCVCHNNNSINFPCQGNPTNFRYTSILYINHLNWYIVFKYFVENWSRAFYMKTIIWLKDDLYDLLTPYTFKCPSLTLFKVFVFQPVFHIFRVVVFKYLSDPKTETTIQQNTLFWTFNTFFIQTDIYKYCIFCCVFYRSNLLELSYKKQHKTLQ